MNNWFEYVIKILLHIQKGCENFDELVEDSGLPKSYTAKILTQLRSNDIIKKWELSKPLDKMPLSKLLLASGMLKDKYLEDFIIRSVRGNTVFDLIEFIKNERSTGNIYW